ncbi:ScbA/BarX family gamma-butyrolactone biosynthesis protein [Nocardia amikacinitolerans]|uniref:ScbA/BarX family gamma-butyrolactone biosynthesis protein n=1 Tax=Nocardia amikacinitolerans TaxID=756689 RepID=UPI0020A5918A|nr:ScbA/BarX family gamma-butyrolactone biosynthesis protein [Nocardia amikacinitolerans]MCP2292844.1 A-factor biosynthesis hotdog domain-containing protein [Nocardia amikacinitolerans]
MTTHAAVEKTATHNRTVPRQLAHRCAVSEVFVTSLDTIGPDTFLVGAQLPRMHAYYGDHAGSLGLRHDPLLVMEAARQAAISLTHEFYGVPWDMAFIVRTFNGTGSDTPAWETGIAPADLVMHVRVPRRHRRGETLHGLDMVLEIFSGGEAMLTVDGSFSWTTPRQWTGLRDQFRESLGLGAFHGAAALGERAGAAAVGRENWRNVVISPPDTDGRVARAALVPDLSHPFLFDHQLDHVPGSLLIEACRQTALSMVLRDLPRLVCVASTFDRFVELDLPAECVAEITEPGLDTTVVHCEIHQAGAVAARVDLEFDVDALDSETIAESR